MSASSMDSRVDSASLATSSAVREEVWMGGRTTTAKERAWASDVSQRREMMGKRSVGAGKTHS